MKNKLNLLIATACFILLISCQKSVNQNPVSNPDRVKTYTENITSSSIGNSNTTYNLSYDNSGRITNITSASSPGDKFVYAFPSDKKYTMDLYNSGTLSIHEDFYMNTGSFMDSTFQYDDIGDTTTEKYMYNINQQLTRVKEYAYAKSAGPVLSKTTNYTYDAIGNLIKTEDTDGGMETYEYYPDLSYTLPVIPGPITITSAKKINLVKKHTVMFNGSLEGSAQFTYTFDDKNRISTEKSVYNDGSIAVKTYTYF